MGGDRVGRHRRGRRGDIRDLWEAGGRRYADNGGMKRDVSLTRLTGARANGAVATGVTATGAWAAGGGPRSAPSPWGRWPSGPWQSGRWSSGGWRSAGRSCGSCASAGWRSTNWWCAADPPLGDDLRQTRPLSVPAAARVEARTSRSGQDRCLPHARRRSRRPSAVPMPTFRNGSAGPAPAGGPAGGRPGAVTRQRPCRRFTLSPKVQPFDPSQFADQVIRPFRPGTEFQACVTKDVDM